MGIQSTVYITRDSAISRIAKIDSLLQQKNYREMEEETSEHDINLANFVNNEKPLNVDEETLEKWTDTMLEDQMDAPFYRHSIFDNYLIKNEDEY